MYRNQRHIHLLFLILLITFVPILFANGLGAWLMAACLLLALLIILLAKRMGWWHPAHHNKTTE